MVGFLSLSVSLYSQTIPAKKNTRPSGADTPEAASGIPEFVPVYSYEFEKPEFLVSHVLIEHDESGKGRIVFEKRDSDEKITEPLALSEKTLTEILALWGELDFLNSSEEYQSPERDFAHLGTMTLKMSRAGSQRTAELNWTENKTAKGLTDLYKRIGNQFIWIFDMNVARRNQPLETPRIMKGFESYLSRKSLADPVQMLPYLRELKDDERIPLIARNHAERLIAKIEQKN